MTDAPVPTGAPVPQPPSYQTQTAPLPNKPPFTVSVTLLPKQISLKGALLVALVAAVDVDCTFTLKEHDVVPLMLSAEQLTAVVPDGNVLPDAGIHVIEGAGKLGDDALNVTTGLHVVISAGHEMLNAFASPVSNSLNVVRPVACVLVAVTVPVTVAVQVEGPSNFRTT